VSSSDPSTVRGYVRRLLSEADGDIAAHLLEDSGA
jgi:hypothetical protein